MSNLYQPKRAVQTTKLVRPLRTPLLLIVLKNETYRWQNTSEGINPTLHLIANTDYLIKIKNPTDTKHELIIGSNGTELAKSNEIEPDKNGKFTFNANSTGPLEYHCEYHPDTMKGIIEISSQ